MAQFFYFLAHEQFQPEALVKHAVLAEKAGFDGLMASEHFHPWSDAGAANFTYSTLGAIAQATEHVELMTAVTTPLWRFHPTVAAQAAATLDRLSGGRFQLGVGMGRAHDEVPAGFNYPPYQERNARMREALEIMQRLLDGEKLTFDGAYYQTQTAKLYTPPMSKVPIYLAASAPKSATLAGEQADGLIVSVKDVAKIKNQAIEPARQAAASKPLQLIATRWTVLADSEDEAWGVTTAQRGLSAPTREMSTDPESLRKQAEELPRSDLLARFTVTNDTREIINNYAELITELDVDVIGVQVMAGDQERAIERLGADVLPELKKI